MNYDSFFVAEEAQTQNVTYMPVPQLTQRKRVKIKDLIYIIYTNALTNIQTSIHSKGDVRN